MAKAASRRKSDADDDLERAPWEDGALSVDVTSVPAEAVLKNCLSNDLPLRLAYLKGFAAAATRASRRELNRLLESLGTLLEDEALGVRLEALEQLQQLAKLSGSTLAPDEVVEAVVDALEAQLRPGLEPGGAAGGGRPGVSGTSALPMVREAQLATLDALCGCTAPEVWGPLLSRLSRAANTAQDKPGGVGAAGGAAGPHGLSGGGSKAGADAAFMALSIVAVAARHLPAERGLPVVALAGRLAAHGDMGVREAVASALPRLYARYASAPGSLEQMLAALEPLCNDKVWSVRQACARVLPELSDLCARSAGDLPPSAASTSTSTSTPTHSASAPGPAAAARADRLQARLLRDLLLGALLPFKSQWVVNAARAALGPAIASLRPAVAEGAAAASAAGSGSVESVSAGGSAAGAAVSSAGTRVNGVGAAGVHQGGGAAGGGGPGRGEAGEAGGGGLLGPLLDAYCAAAAAVGQGAVEVKRACAESFADVVDQAGPARWAQLQPVLKRLLATSDAPTLGALVGGAERVIRRLAPAPAHPAPTRANGAAEAGASQGPAEAEAAQAKAAEAVVAGPMLFVLREEALALARAASEALAGLLEVCPAGLQRDLLELLPQLSAPPAGPEAAVDRCGDWRSRRALARGLARAAAAVAPRAGPEAVAAVARCAVELCGDPVWAVRREAAVQVGAMLQAALPSAVEEPRTTGLRKKEPELGAQPAESGSAAAAAGAEAEADAGSGALRRLRLDEAGPAEGAGGASTTGRNGGGLEGGALAGLGPGLPDRTEAQRLWLTRALALGELEAGAGGGAGAGAGGGGGGGEATGLLVGWLREVMARRTHVDAALVVAACAGAGTAALTSSGRAGRARFCGRP
ncbi:hypothetical protein HYH03_002999 [Edaphochlamys debaryana]|uniref:Uncharacterized protein n=1 Tax=Edaphochlamys debaryana TaxID=47281 RepID=A0A836C3H7_9CHLO|nr:hypothetical protein HYH03_002999 [Edaphochlamys debaryana]|eukprot:KAG2498805.1 hypothetical protein HYH03_002999 [Edaphochlamys debaryana]